MSLIIFTRLKLQADRSFHRAAEPREDLLGPEGVPLPAGGRPGVREPLQRGRDGTDRPGRAEAVKAEGGRLRSTLLRTRLRLATKLPKLINLI